MRLRLVTATAVAGLVVAALPGHAATLKPQISDPAGDANGLNDQGAGAPVPSQSTGPAEYAGADITKVAFVSTFKTTRAHGKVIKKPTGFTVTMTLGAAPMPETFYRITAAIPACDSLFIEFGTDAATGGTAMRCPALPGQDGGIDYTVPEAVQKGSTIKWTVPVSALPAGTTLQSLHAETRGNPALITAPAIDIADGGSATFTIGK